ncbi:MAG: amino acid ABC transporter ATP-binding protein [Corynebacterium flavescens]|nr:amino acid ABC transporter ATP-binding protein [Corynebacterium flavescens]MDN6226600.1 amino acid ABC transporter ATP-binding protein [Corynebacterium flavescens]
MVEISHVHKFYGEHEVLKDISLTVNPVEVVSLIGPSGSGKSTLLRTINHLESIDSGDITVDGEYIGYRRKGDLLASVGLADKGESYPRQLSGGQQQRVAIARALVLDPDVILFDEPTSALDPELVGEVLSVIRQLAQTGKTLIIVTHEISFAREVSDRVVFLSDGALVESGTPEQVLDHPRHERTRAFIESIL